MTLRQQPIIYVSPLAVLTHKGGGEYLNIQTVSPMKPKVTTIWFVFLFLRKICQPLFYTNNIKIKAKWSSIFKNHKKTKSEPRIQFNCPVQFFLNVKKNTHRKKHKEIKHIFFIQDFSKKDSPPLLWHCFKTRILGSSPDEMRYFDVEMPHFIKVTYLDHISCEIFTHTFIKCILYQKYYS